MTARQVAKGVRRGAARIDMAALGVRRPTHAPRARHFVDHVIQLAAALLETGHGYERYGQVYFRGHPAIPGGTPAAGNSEHGELSSGPIARSPTT